MFCKNCGAELSQNLPCQNCLKSVDAKSEKGSFKKVLKIVLYVILAFIFLVSWSIRKEFIVGPIPVVIHLGIFYALFALIKNKLK